MAVDRQSLFGDTSIPADVLRSWERCVRYGLAPTTVTPRPVKDPESDARVIDVAHEAVQSRLTGIQTASVCLSLTDPAGTVLRQWVGNRDIMSRLERLDLVPGFDVTETTIGYTSGTTLVSRSPVMVRGPEHFSPEFARLTSAGNVITHPVTRRVVGSLHLTSWSADTSPMALAWLCEIVADIERRFLETATTAEQLLLKGFLDQNRDARHAVVAVNAQTAMTNAAAAKLLGSIDHTQLWELGAPGLGEAEHPATLTTADGSKVRVHRSAIVGADDSLGVVLRLTRATEPRHPRVDRLVELTGLVGDSPQWTRMRRQLARIGEGNVLLFGENGVGKRSVVRALAGDAQIEVDGSSDRLLDNLRLTLANDPMELAIFHLDAVPTEHIVELVSLLESRPAGSRLLATSRTAPASGVLDPALLDLFPEMIPVPSLKERSEDIAAIIRVLTQRHVAPGRTMHWMQDAIQAVARRAWPDNARSLERVVKHVVTTARHDYVGLRDLPAHVSSGFARRQLTGLERVEAEAILQALRDSDWNKREAAERLGIARSTLYRKMQALGIDAHATF